MLATPSDYYAGTNTGIANTGSLAMLETPSDYYAGTNTGIANTGSLATVTWPCDLSRSPLLAHSILRL